MYFEALWMEIVLLIVFRERNFHPCKRGRKKPSSLKQREILGSWEKIWASPIFLSSAVVLPDPRLAHDPHFWLQYPEARSHPSHKGGETSQNGNTILFRHGNLLTSQCWSRPVNWVYLIPCGRFWWPLALINLTGGLHPSVYLYKGGLAPPLP